MSKNVIHNFDIVIKNSASTKSSEDLKEIFLKELAKVSKEMSKEKDIVQLWQEYKNNSVSTSSNISTERIENNTLEGIQNPIISTLKKAKQDSKISETVSEFKFFNILDNINKVIYSLRANNISSQTLKEEKGLENLHNNLTSQIYTTNVSTEQSLLIPSKITMTGNVTYSDVIKTKIKKKLNAEKEINLTNYEATISKDIFNKTDQEYFVQQSSIDKEDKIENLYKASESSINNMSWKKVSDLMIFKLLELSKEEKNIYLKENYDILIKKIARPNLNIQQLFSEHEELFLLLKTLFPGLPGKITFQTQKTVYPDLGSQKMYPEIGVKSMYFKAPLNDSKYNVKQDELGLGMDARQYDPVLRKWIRIDPIEEKNAEWTSYTTLNNPLKFVDPIGMSASLPNDYVFNEKGEYVRTDKTNKSDKLVIEDSKTRTKKYYSFNDLITDVNAIKYNIKKFGKDFKDIKFIYFLSGTKINEMMKESDVHKRGYLGRRWFAMTQSYAGKMDFTVYHLSKELWVANMETKWDFINELSKDKGPIFLIDTQSKAYNMFDAGNWLWGNAVYRLGGTKEDAKDWSTKFNSNDSEADQNAIINGWFYKNGPKKG